MIVIPRDRALNWYRNDEYARSTSGRRRRGLFVYYEGDGRFQPSEHEGYSRTRAYRAMSIHHATNVIRAARKAAMVAILGVHFVSGFWDHMQRLTDSIMKTFGDRLNKNAIKARAAATTGHFTLASRSKVDRLGCKRTNGMDN